MILRFRFDYNKQHGGHRDRPQVKQYKISNERYAALSFKKVYSKTLSGYSKRRPKLFLKTDNRLMQVKSIAECSTIFDLH